MSYDGSLFKSTNKGATFAALPSALRITVNSVFSGFKSQAKENSGES